jgi:hypothetical protein
MTQLKKGDVVRLKCDQRRMVVEDTGGKDDMCCSEGIRKNGVWCVWIENGRKCGDWFDPDTLESC